MELKVGAATVDITPALGLPMGGYSARKHPCGGINDPITARLVLFDDGATRLALVVCDLVATPPDLVGAIRESVSRALGTASANVCVAATHTHSGPILGGDASLVREAAGKVEEGATSAMRTLRQVRLKAHAGEVNTVGRSRRDPEGAYDPLLSLLVADTGASLPPAATLMNFACHATVLEWDNLHYSADYPGAARRVVERLTGGPAVFVQGAAGDINPLWLRHDFAEAERIGSIVGSAATQLAFEALAAGEDQRVINLSWDEALPVRTAGAALDDASLAAASSLLDLPRRVLPELDELEARHAELRAQIDGLSPGDPLRRELMPLANELRMARARKRHAPAVPGETQRVEVQAFRLAGGCGLVALPGEFCVATGRRLRASGGVPWLFVCGYANDYVSYVPPAEEFPRHGYEVGCALFEPEAEDLIVQAALRLLRQLFPDDAE